MPAWLTPSAAVWQCYFFIHLYSCNMAQSNKARCGFMACNA